MASVIDTPPFNEYTANGATTVFAYEFQVLSSVDMVVRVNGAVVATSAYSLSGVGDLDGGAVTFTVAPANLSIVLLSREMELSRDTDYQYNGDLREDVVDRDFNRLWLALQGVNSAAASTMRVPVPRAINPIAPEANKLLGWNSAGTQLINYTASGAPFSAASITYDPGWLAALPRTAEARLRDSISVMDFGAVGDKAADDSDAVEAAIAYAISVGRDLYMPRMHKLTRTVSINRLVDSGPADKYFTIWGGGGVYCDTAITMFGTSLPYTGNPNSQLVRFHNISFECSAPEITAYAIDGKKFLRTIFDSVSFVRIKCLIASTYTQSIYLYNCNSRRWLGSFFHCLHGVYDLQVIGGLYEAGQTCFDLVYPRGSKFYTQIEGMQEWALKLAGCSAVHISCYFEDNGTDFDCRNSNYPNKGVLINNCFVVRSGGPGFIWGTADACVSEGNYSTGNGTYTLHDLQSDSNVAINDFSDRGAVGLSNEDAVSHSGYRQGTVTSLGLRTSGSASYTVSNLVCSYTRMGKVVNLIFKCTLTSNATHAAADAAYIVSGLPGVAENVDVVCGQITVNNVASTMELIETNPPRPVSLTAVVPANVSGNAFNVSGNITYFAT